MGASTKFWTMYRIHPSSETRGYQTRQVAIARAFVELHLQQSGQHLEETALQSSLVRCFQAKEATIQATHRAQAGLCLRCVVSYPILNACKKLDSLFGNEKGFTYRDLLPFVLNDDGETLIVLDDGGKTQLVVEPGQASRSAAYKVFSVEVLRSFKPNASNMNLENWAFFQTKQQPELRAFLSEFGFQQLSDWALLNRVRLKQLEQLSSRDRTVVEIFHEVYRRDRIEQRQRGIQRCPDPSIAQLQEMLGQLQKRNVWVATPKNLLAELRQIALQLRQFDLWSYREPLEIQDSETQEYVPRPDLYSDSLDEADFEQQEFREFLNQQLHSTMVHAIETEIKALIRGLEKSKRYAPFAQTFIPGLQLYYSQNLSLREIAPMLGMSSWDQARRILNPGELLSRVRMATVQQLSDRILEKAQQKGLAEIPPKPDYLKHLLEQVEAFVDAEIFQSAAEEIKAGKHRSMNSVYAQHIRAYVEQNQQEQTINVLQVRSK